MRNKQKSLNRRINRGHAKLEVSDFVENENGTPKVTLKERSKRGIWYSKN